MERARANLTRLRGAMSQLAMRVSPETPNMFAADLFSWSSGKRIRGSGDIDGRVPVYGGNGITGSTGDALLTEKTIVIGRVGALCGNVYQTEGPAWVTDNAIYAQSHDPRIHLDYAALVFRSSRLRDRAAGTGQPFVNQRILNEVQIPMLPMDEQIGIVTLHRAVEQELSGLEDQLKSQDQRAIRLRASILAAAFSGNLVLQYSSDEPASVLLERIGARRASTDFTRRRGPKPRTLTEDLRYE